MTLVSDLDENLGAFVFAGDDSDDDEANDFGSGHGLLVRFGAIQ